MLNAGIGRILQFGTLLHLVAAQLTSQAQTNFEWKDASGNMRNLSNLQAILQKHVLWLAGEKLGIRADFSGADLSGANLSGAHLNGAHLIEANLSDADLSGARLDHAHLDGAFLSGANLKGAYLNRANLCDAEMHGGCLSGADLTVADLSGSLLFDVNLTGADLGGADLGEAYFEPKSLPELRGIAAAENLELLTYSDNPDALVQLRKQFEDGGFRAQERKITYALKRRETELSCEKCTSRKLLHGGLRPLVLSSDSVLGNCFSFVLNKVFFDWTCQFGMSPGQPLMLGTVLWLICSLLYFVCLQRSGETGLYRVHEQRLGDAPAATRRFEKISISSIRRFRRRQRPLQFLRDEWLLLRASLFFSLMSAFNIGFRDINFGRWLRLLTRQEFDIKAIGWVRVVAGWQSLISVYLLALWVLTYFGRPFG